MNANISTTDRARLRARAERARARLFPLQIGAHGITFTRIGSAPDCYNGHVYAIAPVCDATTDLTGRLLRNVARIGVSRSPFDGSILIFWADETGNRLDDVATYDRISPKQAIVLFAEHRLTLPETDGQQAPETDETE